MKGWQYKPDIVAGYVDNYKKMYADNVNYELITGDYDATMETKFIGGQQVDMAYIEVEKIERWLEANWIKDLDSMDGVAEIKKAMYPAELVKFSTKDGKLGALPYFTAWFIMAYNQNHIEKLGGSWTPPTTWDAFLEVCRQLKKDGISAQPYVPMWQPEFSYMNDQLFTDMYSEGEPIFDKDFNPTFGDGSVAFRSVLERYQTFYKEDLIVKESLTKDMIETFSTGDHSFWSYVVYGLPSTNDPKSSKIAGKVRLMQYPGKVGNVITVGGGYAMGKKSTNETADWELLKYFGYKDKAGQFNVSKQWALKAGLPSAYPAVMDDPEVVASFKQSWGDIEEAKKQATKAQARNIDKTLWASEWMKEAMTKTGDYIIGKMAISDLLKDLNDKAIALKKQYS